MYIYRERDYRDVYLTSNVDACGRWWSKDARWAGFANHALFIDLSNKSKHEKVPPSPYFALPSSVRASLVSSKKKKY
jgi:hypothetical protein